ncbi:MAG: hypothetical protein ACXWCY_20345 [Burkholderiales bacterium]
MRKAILFSALLLSGVSHAADVRVTVSGEVRPGVYGRVEIGRAPPPAVVYAEPVVIVQQPRYVPVQPIYMHVPPGHAKHWDKHCRKYDACGVPVYFVKSDEYEVKKGKKRKHKHKHKEWD